MIDKKELMRFANLMIKTGLNKSESLKLAWFIFKPIENIKDKIKRVYNFLLLNKIKNSTAWPCMLAILASSNLPQNEIDLVYGAFIHVCEYKNHLYTIGVPPLQILKNYINFSYIKNIEHTKKDFIKFHIDYKNEKTENLEPIKIIYKLLLAI